MDWCDLNYVSHTAWAVNDKDEPWSILDPWIGMDDTPPPPPEGNNIALNQPTARSSIENSSYESANAVDGSGSTRWSSQFSDPQWIYVDLGAQKAVDSVQLNWEAAYATAYQIQVSDDASAWADVYSTSSGNGGIDTIDLGGVVTRYVRMYGTQRGTSYGYSLWEFEVYESPPVVLYQDSDYGGWSASFGVGAYTISDILAAGGVNDDASSLLISPDYTITLYEHDNFAGSSLVLTEDTPDLSSYGFNDIVSSMVVEVSGGDTTPPAAPTGLSATPGDATVSLDWNDNSEPDLAGYDVYRSTTSGGPYNVIDFDLTQSNYTDNSVSNGTTYYYVVTAVDTSLNESGYSNEDSATPTAGSDDYQESGGVCTMEAENATVDQRADNITWVLATSESGYVGSGYMTPPDNTGTTVTWSTGCELAWDVEISTAGVYYMAVRRLALDNGDDSARVGVGDSERDDNTFNGPTGSVWQWSRGTDFDLGNLSAGTHTIQIRRREDGFCIDRVMIADSWSKLPADGSTEAGPAENPTGGQPPDTTPPAAPTGLAATAGDATVSLDWDDNSEPDLAGYDVYRSTTSGSGYSRLNGPLVGSSDYTDNSVSNGTTYYYVVTAVDTSSNESGYSNEDSATPADTTAPTPNPATFASPPSADSDTAISMTATTGSDPSGPVEYLFTETSGNPGGTSSAWQTSASYTDSGLNASTQYTYTVTMRDSLANIGTASSGASATTQAAPDTDPPTPNPATFASAPSADSDTAISMTATTGSDPSGPVEYLFTETSGNPGGTSSTWQTSASYTDSGLNPSTQYTYTVTMRDSLTNTGSASSGASATTDPPSQWTEINSNDFESSWGIWNDGGSDCRRSSRDSAYAHQGNYCVRIRDNTSTSVATTDSLNLSGYSEVKVDFWYYPRSMDNSNEDFWLQISTDGGSNFTTVEEWNTGDEFVNGNFYPDSVTITGYALTSNTQLRFRCDASGNNDYIYIDEVIVSAK
jgi:fibronectin type 3 domain-containing protein